MVGHKKFSSVNYVDLFAGCGVDGVREGLSVRRYPGSALLAAGCEKPFDNLFLVDENVKKIEALRMRMRRLGSRSKVHTWCGDANVLIDNIAQAIPDGSLTVAFIDPYGLNIHFESVRRLAKQRPLDLLILFADAMDIVRNVEREYYPRKNGNLDLFLGEESRWRERWDKLDSRDGGRARQLFARIYLDQLATIGYTYSATRVIEGDKGPLYRLVFASKHPLGLKFWRIAESEDLEGTRSLFGTP